MSDGRLHEDCWSDGSRRESQQRATSSGARTRASVRFVGAGQNAPGRQRFG